MEKAIELPARCNLEKLRDRISKMPLTDKEKLKVVEEFYEHANEELKHADWLADRIIQLGGIPILDPIKFNEYAKCKYDAPTNPDTKVLVEQNLLAERCAVGRYQQICEICQGKDYETFNISRKILNIFWCNYCS